LVILKKINLNFFPVSLLSESHKVLGDEFLKLTDRIQTGYVKVFWNHYGIIKKNRHKKRKDSFAMGRKEVESNFTEAKDFVAVNDNGYYLVPFTTRHGISENKYKVRRKDESGSIHCSPTGWLVRTVLAASRRYYNGFKLSPKISTLMGDWYVEPRAVDDKPLGFVNSDGESITNVVNRNGGAIFRNKSKNSKGVNVNANIRINKQALLRHKKLLQPLIKHLKDNNIEMVIQDTNEWNIVKNMLITNNDIDSIKIRTERLGDLGGGKVKVNTIDPLESLLYKDIKTEGVEQRIVEIDRLLVAQRENKELAVPVIYTEASTGRYTAKGGVLQGYHKSVRYSALSGCYEYDLEAAHQNILLQLLKRKGADFPELATMKEYVDNKQEIRVQLSTDLDTSVDIIKSIINLLTYGGTLSRSKQYCKLYEVCNENSKLLERVVSNKWFKRYSKAFNESHKRLVGKSINIRNAVGIDKEVRARKKGKALAHILQGCERQVLDAVIKHSNRNDIALLVHDCVVFYNRQSPEELSRIVLEETGFNLEFSEDKYTDE
jgi:hypothetical protein